MIVKLIYNLLLPLVAPFFLYGLYKKKEGKPSIGNRWQEHFGKTPPLKSSSRPIWIHAVSVGESIAATPVIKALKKSNPQISILVTTTTTTGAEQIAKLGDLVEHRYMPLDFPFAIKSFLTTVNPSQLLIMETELWLNTVHLTAKAGIPISVINARLSERSRNRYQKLLPLFSRITKYINQVLCQTSDDSKRFEEVGVPKEKLIVTGSIKFDIEIADSVLRDGLALANQLKSDSFIWIAASTHKGEDEIILQAHKTIQERYPNSVLILVPRHPERFSEVYELSIQYQFKTQRRTSKNLFESCDVYLGDTMGEMLTMIQAADYCFMGGSLLGDKVGGHNLLEPAALGKPMLTGPSYYNFTEITKKLLEVKALEIVENNNQIANCLYQYHLRSDKVSAMKNASIKVVEENRGAVEKTIAVIEVTH